MIYTLTLNPAVDRELTVPNIEYDTVLRATRSRVDCGGKGFNVSRQLMGLGAPSTAVGFLGGKTGEILEQSLRSLGIGVNFVWISEETRTNISIVTPTGGHTIKVNEKGPGIPPEKQRELIEKIEQLARPGDWWVLAGSLPPGVPESFYAQIVQRLNQCGAHTLLDTTSDALRLGCLEKPLLVKPNREEAGAMIGLPLQTVADGARCAARICELGAQNVVISMGSAGALLHTPEDAWLARSPTVVEMNPIGAGDSLAGGLVWALSRGLSLQESLRWGVASGAATASLNGTQVGSQALIESLLAQTQLEKLDF